MAAVFHLAVEYAMSLFLFHWIMLVGLLSFSRTSDWVRLRQLIPLPRRAKVPDAEISRR